MLQGAYKISRQQLAVPVCCDEVEAVMTHMEIKALEHRTATVWTEGYDGESHYTEVLKALAPALFILAVAAALMVAIL